jgi:hypothetical protein
MASFVGTAREGRKPEGYRQQTISTASAALANIPPAAIYADIIVEAQSIRTRDDGIAPTSSVGMLYAAADRIALHSRREINQFRAIRSGGTDAVLNISFYSADRKAYA